MNTFRVVRVLSLVVWLGGIIFFSFVVAPAVFQVLTPVTDGRHLAGDIVNHSLRSLHWMGLVSGLAFIFSAATLHRTLAKAEIGLVIIMLVITAIAQFGIMPRMERVRSSPGFETSSDFDHLHKMSVFAEGGVLLLGLFAVWQVAGTRSNRPYRR
jgi:uncharacterized membrane protein